MEESRQKLVVGLGNPGSRYDETRHNVGFEVVAELARRRRCKLDRQECKALVGGDPEVLLALPQTYMNRSGYAVRCLFERRGFEPGDLLVVFDEVHLPLGRLRLRRKGTPGGHRGMESVVDSLRTSEVARLRLGVGPAADPEGAKAARGPAGEDLVEFVLAPFDRDERPAAEEMIQTAADACEAWLGDSIETVMNRFNR